MIVSKLHTQQQQRVQLSTASKMVSRMSSSVVVVVVVVVVESITIDWLRRVKQIAKCRGLYPLLWCVKSVHFKILLLCHSRPTLREGFLQFVPC